MTPDTSFMIMPETKMTPDEINTAVEGTHPGGTIIPRGSTFIHMDSPWSPYVRPVQFLALRNLYGKKITRAEAWAAASAGHTSCPIGGGLIAESTRPRAQTRAIKALIGKPLIVAVPAECLLNVPGEGSWDTLFDLPTLSRVADRMVALADSGADYPELELIYYLKWATHVVCKIPVWSLFRRKENCCSGACIQAGLDEGLFEGLSPEMVYPARMLVMREMCSIMRIKVTQPVT